MRTKTSILFLIGLGLMLINSCRKKETNCDVPVFGSSPVSHVEGANTAQVNQEISLTVYSQSTNGCSYSYDAQIKETINGFSRTVQILSKSDPCNTYCPTWIVQVTSIYQFKAGQPGIYTLKFLKYNNEYLEHVITVQ